MSRTIELDGAVLAVLKKYSNLPMREVHAALDENQRWGHIRVSLVAASLQRLRKAERVRYIPQLGTWVLSRQGGDHG